MSEIRGRIKMSKDFQNKYVGYMILSLVLGVLGIGVIGIVYFVVIHPLNHLFHKNYQRYLSLPD